MLGSSLLKAAGIASILSTTAAALGCVGREPGQFLEDTSFEEEDSFAWTSRGAVLESTPTYPAHSGNHML